MKIRKLNKKGEDQGSGFAFGHIGNVILIIAFLLVILIGMYFLVKKSGILS